ncbi:PIG-L family deacetylase [bacterium]|uniref:LmbE family protein n=1 Tax=candidate division WWE3 bacterium CG22_combo_CG10-13_8_21_14_all_39_12 TaxID=1975094 RepID=A0A2H0BFK8_UNCKA|nr:PIG-L family deacetylase [bacterium]PIP56456.1 MAG: hypothetical protein COX05_03030 [candidate division WWE3 bacterium CG22_combo_CG10-13_8_21_14_all_39_12]
MKKTKNTKQLNKNVQVVSTPSVLVISAHADDHIACAGTLLKLKDMGYAINEIVLTTSEEGRDFRHPEGDYNVAELRSQELSKASEFLGVSNTFMFGEEDLNLQYSKELVFRVVQIIRTLRPRVGIMHSSFDWHPDHRAAFAISSEAFKMAATGIQPEKGDQWRTPVVIAAEGMLPVQPNILVDVTAYAQKKLTLWKIYESQAKPKAINFEESLMQVRGYHVRRPGSFMAEAFTTDPTSPMLLFDDGTNQKEVECDF